MLCDDMTAFCTSVFCRTVFRRSSCRHPPVFSLFPLLFASSVFTSLPSTFPHCSPVLPPFFPHLPVAFPHLPTGRRFPDVLLCHDDELDTRRIAFILYLSPAWKLDDDGGRLDLYDMDGNTSPPLNSNWQRCSFIFVCLILCKDGFRCIMIIWINFVCNAR